MSSQAGAPIHIGTALFAVEDESYAIREIAADLQRDLTDFLRGTALAGNGYGRLEEFARRASALNKGHRHSLRQALRDGGQVVSFLYGGTGTGGNTFEGSARALQDLELSVAQMSQTCQTLFGAQDQLEHLYSENLRLGQGVQSSWRRTLVLRRSLNNVKTFSKVVREEEHDIHEQLERLMPSFLLVAHPEYHARALEAIRAQKINQSTFRRMAEPLFSSLDHLSDEKMVILRKVECLAQRQQTSWMERGLNVIPAGEVKEALSKYKKYSEELSILKSKQEVVLQKLRGIAALCRQSPAMLPGPHGSNIPIIDVIEVAANFASVRFRAAHTTEIAASIIDNLQEAL